MEPVDTKPTTKEEEVFDLGNFSDYDENQDQDACGGDNNHKSAKDPSKTKTTCSTDPNKVCGTECQTQPAVPVQEIPADRLCKKCKEKRGTLKYRSEPCCKDCYLNGLEHRFRAGLRTHVKLSKKDDQVLCCLSGGQSSLAMCRMISESLFNPSPRKMFFKAQIIHINEAALFNVSAEEEQENLNKIKKFSELYQLSVTVRNIEDIYDVHNPELKALLHQSYGATFNQEDHKEPEEAQVLDKAAKRAKLQALLSSLSDTGSSRDDMVYVFNKILIVDFALKNSLPRVFFGDTAQKVAINSLTLLCKGRGADLFDRTSPEEKVFPSVTIYRPMNDFLTKEILVYDYFTKLGEFYVMNPKLEDSVPTSKRYPGNGSINTLLENFIDKLQAGFPSTVHTVLNTLTKVKPKFDEKRICPICLGKKDKLGNILEKGSIIEYLKPHGSQEVQEEKPKTGLIDMEFESRKIKEDYLQSNYFQSKSNFEKAACFSCGRIFENAKDVSQVTENLPGLMKSNVQGVCSHTMPKSINQAAFDYYFYDYDAEL